MYSPAPVALRHQVGATSAGRELGREEPVLYMGVQVVYPKPKEARSFRKRAATCNVHFIPSVLTADQSTVNHTICKHTLTQK